MAFGKMNIDVIIGLQYGDEGKGKISHHLLKDGDYDVVMRFNGGGNAGHTIYHHGEKFVTHHLPSGVFYDGPVSYIGNGCVIHPASLMSEIRGLRERGITITSDNLKIANNTHVVQDIHLAQDKAEGDSIGTTKRGIGPAYTDKYARRGVTIREFVNDHVEEYGELHDYLVDSFDFLYAKNQLNILCEGAQAFGLDIDFGDYPFVTSSHCGVGSVFLNGLPPQYIRHVYGVIKPYETYVGAKKFQDMDDPVLAAFQSQGFEVGATTGRIRQCNWIDFEKLERAIVMNGVTHLVVNKMDIFENVVKEFGREREIANLKRLINVMKFIPHSTLDKVYYSYSPEHL
jgi:adenylosuccinate synthase